MALLICTKCGEEKPPEAFGNSNTNRTRGFKASWCKECVRRGNDVKRANNPEVWRGYGRKTRHMQAYGLTPEEADRLRENPCEICGENVKKRVIDHSTPGSYHGVLCHACNTSIGHFLHDPERLLKAAEYVRRTRG